MTNLQLVNANEVQLTNKKLATVTQSIIKKGNQISKNIYQIAKQLATVETNELYVDDGFKNASDYAEKVLGIKKSFANTLVRAGKDYIEKDGTNLPVEGDKDFTISQLQELMPLGDRDKVAHHVECGDVTPDMSTKKIREVVKELKNPKSNEEVVEEEIQSTGNELSEREVIEQMLFNIDTSINQLAELVGEEEAREQIEFMLNARFGYIESQVS